MPLPLWAGRTMALLGIVLVGVNLRTAVGVISPIISHIAVEVPLDSVALGILGAIPPVAFALSALTGAILARRFGLERLLAVAIVSMVVGQLVRAGASSFGMLFIGSVFALIGAGIGNVLLPPLVKRYFPDRIGLVTTLYVTVMAIGTAAPAALSAPIADSAGWRVSLAVWSVLAFASLIPWVAVLAQHRRERAALSSGDEAPELDEPPARMARSVWRSKTAWMMGCVFALSSFHAYSAFAWLPKILVDIAGVTPIQAGTLLALFGIMGLPAALIVPVLTARVSNVNRIIQVGILSFVLGYLGLLLAPSTLTWLWVILIGIGQLLFPVCLTLINLRSRTHEGSVALSGVVQTVGYTLGALGPLTVGILHNLTGGWTVPIFVLIGTALLCTIAGYRLARPVYVEDEAR